MKQIVRIFVVLIAVACPFAAAQPATTQSAEVSPDAAKVLDAMQSAYAKLTSLELSGELLGEFDIDEQQENHSTDFTATFTAPNKFRHEAKGEGVMGSTGEKLYVYIKSRNAYATTDAPKEKSLVNKLPDPFAELLAEKDLSLALALSSDPAAELKAAYAKIEKAADVEVDGKKYTALKLTNQKGDGITTMLVDPATHLVRRVATDIAAKVKARGAQDVRKAVVTIDYTTTTPNAPAKADAYAWIAPPGAKDAQDMTDESLGGPGGTGEVANHILKDKPAPDFKLTTLDGTEVALKDLKGSVVVLDFWATWCGPCVASLPKLDELAKETAEKGVKIFAVNQGEDKELVQGFMKSKKLTVPVLLDDDSKVGNRYKAQAIPETVVIGKDGVVRAVFFGSGAEDGIRKAVEEALQ